MTTLVIEDGKGTGNKAQVQDNKLQTESVSVPKFADVSGYEGGSYLIASGAFITLTNQQEHALFYFKYTGSNTLHVESIRTCGTGSQKWKLYKNATAGTLISGGSSLTAYNMNLTSNNILSATSLKGADSSTVTDGTIIENWINNSGHSVEDYQGGLILGKNDTLVLTCENSATIDVCFRMLCYEHAE